MKILENNTKKIVVSKDYNYIFNKNNGVFIRWGKDKEDDPLYAPSNEILDLEVTTSCKYVCKFCFPEDTKIKLFNGYEKNIQNIEAGDKVYSYNGSDIIVNTVQECYKREYQGKIFEVELENGQKLKMTPNHPVFVKNKGWVPAEELKENDEVILYNDEK